MIAVSAVIALTAANTVPATNADDQSASITAEDLKPPECASITLTAVVTGSGTFNGTAAAELVTASNLVDDVRAQGGSDCLLGGGSGDTLRGNGGNDVILAGDGADSALGGGGGDVVYGGAGNDSLRGNNGNDTLRGESGNDFLRGDGGTDVCIGGPGFDTFHSSCETQIQ